jgi:predicted GIY-YIG superfamily endonuclease
MNATTTGRRLASPDSRRRSLAELSKPRRVAPFDNAPYPAAGAPADGTHRVPDPQPAPMPEPELDRDRPPARTARTTDSMCPQVSGAVVYLVHFSEPYRHARHYTGWTTDLEARLAEHRAGRGARLLAVITQAGIDWTLARTWQGTRQRERQLKRQGGASRRCPICRAERERAQ